MKKALMFLAGLVGWYGAQALACPIYPLEALFRGYLRGPLMTQAQSKSNAWAGRTTLNSGSASVVISTSAINSDSLVYHMLQAPFAAGYSVQGLLAIASGSISGTVSTTAVYSGQNIQVGLQTESAPSSGSGKFVRVNSIVDGVSFAVSRIDSGAFSTGANNIMWRIPEAIPKGLKVNSLASGSYMSLGWVDERPRPMDVTVMWELRRTS